MESGGRKEGANRREKTGRKRRRKTELAGSVGKYEKGGKRKEKREKRKRK